MFGAWRHEEGVEHTSGIQRMCQSIMCALIGAPILWLIAAFVLGWNEQRAVCDWKAIGQGEGEVVAVGCDKKEEGDNKLVMFTCAIQQISPTKLSFTLPTGDVSVDNATGLSIETEVLQCVEHRQTQKDSVGGGTTTVKTYRLEWRSSPVNDHNFVKGTPSWYYNCARNNEWPSGLPHTGTKYADSVGIGAYSLHKAFVEKIPLDKTVKSLDSGSSNVIGSWKATIKSNNPATTEYTVLGHNSKGWIQKWVAKDSWMCSGAELGEVKSGRVSKPALFKQMKSASSFLTYVLRFVGWIVFWIGFSVCFGPFEVAADFIPCIGPFLGDAISAVTCCISCLPATGCSLLIISIAWTLMRPMVGLPLLLASCIFIGVFIYLKYYYRKPTEEEDNDGTKE